MNSREILARFPDLSVLVVGDICLDRWCTYDPALSEPSRETGIPRLAVTQTLVTPGAGGTVASNAASLGVGNVAVLGVIGPDGFGYELKQALNARRISTEHLIAEERFKTFTYTKLLRHPCGSEDQPRVDFINTGPLPRDAENALISRLHDIASLFDVLIVADQAETHTGGVVTTAVRDALAQIARVTGISIWADSRMRVEHFHHMTVKVNEEEARQACLRVGGIATPFELRARLEAPALIVTHGGDGATIVTAHEERRLPTQKISNPVDICGAGDSFCAGAACAQAAGAPLPQAVAFGNLVSSITIMKRGTGTASPEEVLGRSRS